MANCFNDGTITIWDLKNRLAVSNLSHVHKDFIYKLRKINDSILSCGNDSYAVITDLQRQKQTASLLHPDSVWCSYPINNNVVSSVGLFGSIFFWDIRSKSIVQVCELNNH